MSVSLVDGEREEYKMDKPCNLIIEKRFLTHILDDFSSEENLKKRKGKSRGWPLHRGQLTSSGKSLG